MELQKDYSDIKYSLCIEVRDDGLTSVENFDETSGHTPAYTQYQKLFFSLHEILAEQDALNLNIIIFSKSEDIVQTFKTSLTLDSIDSSFRFVDYDCLQLEIGDMLGKLHRIIYASYSKDRTYEKITSFARKRCYDVPCYIETSHLLNCKDKIQVLSIIDEKMLTGKDLAFDHISDNKVEHEDILRPRVKSEGSINIPIISNEIQAINNNLPSLRIEVEGEKQNSNSDDDHNSDSERSTNSSSNNSILSALRIPNFKNDYEVDKRGNLLITGLDDELNTQCTDRLNALFIAFLKTKEEVDLRSCYNSLYNLFDQHYTHIFKDNASAKSFVFSQILKYMHNNECIKSCYMWIFISLYDKKFDKESMNEFFSTKLQLEGLKELHPYKSKKETTFPPLDKDDEKYIIYKIADLLMQNFNEDESEIIKTKSQLTRMISRSWKKLSQDKTLDSKFKSNLKSTKLTLDVFNLLRNEKVIEICGSKGEQKAIFDMENLKEFKNSIKAHL